jgi:hypothetical protein
MRSLCTHHIVDLYYWIDTLIPKEPISSGRPALLTSTEVVTILVWHTLVLKQKTFKDIHDTVCLYHKSDFTTLPKYTTFVAQCHRALPVMYEVLEQLLCDTEAVRILDATMLPVSKPHRADRHKVAKDIATFGKNWQGWHYGFKLHVSTSLDGRLCSLMLTGANVYDAQAMPKLLNQHCRLAVGDTLYGAKVMGKIIRDSYGTAIIAPPWPTQKQKVSTPWQMDLLNQRSKIECVFDYLKEHLHLVTSFPRSVRGYVLHYVRVLLSYQIGILARI